MIFTSPNQLLASDDDAEYKGYTLLVHPDFIRNYPLGKNIKNFGFFILSTKHYTFLKGKKAVIFNIFKNIEDELLSSH